jgi:1,4-alpha-glucan branching enzyme
MVDAFAREGVGVILDAVLGHYPFRGNDEVRAIDAVGIHRFINGFGKPVFGSASTMWGTYRWDYENPYVRIFLIDGVLTMLKNYGLSGIRIDNVDGIRERPAGGTFLRELNKALYDHFPWAIILGEMFSDQTSALTSVEHGGLGFHAANDVDFFYNFVQPYLQAFDQDINLWRLEWFLTDSWKWRRAPMQRWITNHDESANKQPGASGDYVATLLKGGDWSYVIAKTKVWGAVAMTTGAFYLDMPQMRFLQEGNFNHNPDLDWSLTQRTDVRGVDDFFSALTKLVRDLPEFAARNLHPHISNHIDNDNKVASLLRVDFATGRKTYVIVNLGSRELHNYRLGVDASRGKNFEILIDSDSAAFSGLGRLEKMGFAVKHRSRLTPSSETLHGKTQSLLLPVLAPHSMVLLRESE